MHAQAETEFPSGVGSSSGFVGDGATQSSARLDRLTGSLVAGKYYILELLGEGGMGQVYKARHLSLDRLVCVKILRAQLASNPTVVGRFEREAKSASRLKHPNSIQVLDFGPLDKGGGFYIVMEFVEGRDLATLLNDEWPLPEARTCHIVAQVLSALTAAHTAQVIHRDLKPENIMLERIGDDPDFVKVLDFGIAKIVAPEVPGLTRGDLVCGTPQYMSPEQATGAIVDARSDLYSVGVILYRMVTGFLPFEGRNPMDFLTKHATERPIPPRLRRPDALISPAMEALVLRALEKDPARRPQSAEEFRRELLMIGAAATDPRYSLAGGARPTSGTAPTLDFDNRAPAQTTPYAAAQTHAATTLAGTAPSLPGVTASRDLTNEVLAERKRLRNRKLVSLAVWAVVLALGAAAYVYFEPQIPPEWKSKPQEWYAWVLAQVSERPKPGPGKLSEPLAPPTTPSTTPQRPPGKTRKGKAAAVASTGDAVPETPEPGDDSGAIADPESDSACPRGMVLVSAPSFAPFCIDRYEYPNVAGTYPAVLKTWDDAKADCSRLHKRLCTADEWEHACQGPHKREYAGTNEYTPGDSQGCNGADLQGRRSRIVPSGARKKCLSGYAVFDLSGNAAEWTATPVDATGADRIIKGGSVEGVAGDLRCGASVVQPRSTMSDVVGFRCCADRD